jgi:hypothetical protein
MNDDHDILLELKGDVCWIKKILGNHLKHHWLITLGALTAAMGSIGTLIVFLLVK